jgi:hypothetical protein
MTAIRYRLSPPGQARRHAGGLMIEAAMSVAVAATLAGTMLPGLAYWRRRLAAQAFVRALHRALLYARAQAIVGGVDARVVPWSGYDADGRPGEPASGPGRAGPAWSAGFAVFIAQTQHGTYRGGAEIDVRCARREIRFRATQGRLDAKNNGTLTVRYRAADGRGMRDAATIVVAPSGRVRLQ